MGWGGRHEKERVKDEEVKERFCALSLTLWVLAARLTNSLGSGNMLSVPTWREGEEKTIIKIKCHWK